MNLRLKLIGLAMLVLSAFTLPAPNSEAQMLERAFETQLANGMKVILVEDHKAPVVTFQVWYRVGSRNEAWGKSGLTHLIEHLMFKGTEKISAGEFIRTIQENGGNYNAFTSQDFTAYFENLSADRVQISLGLESDRMKNLVFRDNEFQTERLVVLEERRLRLVDDPQAFLMEQVNAAAFEASPYHWPIIGWPEDLARLTPEDARSYYAKYYNPVNAFLVVVGDFNRDTLLAGIEKSFGTIVGGSEPERYSYEDPPQTGERRVVVRREAQVPSIIMAYHVPNLRSPDSYVLDIISTLLSGGKSSRLNERLVRKERLAISADAENSRVSVDPSLFYVSAELLPGKDPADAEKVLNEEIEKLKNEPVSEDELTKAKNQLESAFVFGQDSVFQQGMLLATYEIALSWKSLEDYLPAIRRVSPDDVRRVAGRYFTPENRTVGILLPSTEKEEASSGGTSAGGRSAAKNGETS